MRHILDKVKLQMVSSLYNKHKLQNEIVHNTLARHLPTLQMGWMVLTLEH